MIGRYVLDCIKTGAISEESEPWKIIDKENDQK